MKRVLQIGTGRWGTNHLRVLRSLPVDLFVSDVRAEAYQKSCLPLEVPADHFSTDPRAFLERMDAVDVVTPADSHFALVGEALEAGKDVFVEKPITLASAEARELAERAGRRGLILQVGHIFRFDPASAWLRAAIAEGRLGTLRMLRARFAGFKRPRSDSGVLLADGIHFLDLFSHLLGTVPARVTAVLHDFLGRGMDDEAWIGLAFDGGAGGSGGAGAGGEVWATVECGYHLPGKARDLLVVGSELSVHCDFNEPENKIRAFPNRMTRSNGEFQPVEGKPSAIGFPPKESLHAELSAFVDSLTSRKPPLAGGWDGYQSLLMVEAAMASAREGRTVELRSDLGAGEAGGPGGRFRGAGA
jgi:UDP-N-acetylglucosamine 3-dehydrogenase